MKKTHENTPANVGQSGFTLVELLVVIAIIGVLAAVGTQAYTGYTASAKIKASQANFDGVKSFIAAEMAKCSSSGALSTLPGLTTPPTCPVTSANTGQLLTHFTRYFQNPNSGVKNPYNTSQLAIAAGTAPGAIRLLQTTSGGLQAITIYGYTGDTANPMLQASIANE
jgi:prepilin-type N-terminal cleavage/methylation domain-containing protein